MAPPRDGAGNDPSGPAVPETLVRTCERLLELARQGREALRRGDAAGCVPIMAERQRLVETLLREAPRCPPEARERLAGLLGEVLAIDRDSSFLARVILQETGEAVGRLSAGRTGAAAYLRDGGRAGRPPRNLNGRG